MKTKMTEMFGIEVPIFAFSHCRDVVIEVSRAGGFGVLGVAYHSPRQLREELNWIESHIEGKPYGVDVLLPGTYKPIDQRVTQTDLPPLQTEYLRRKLDEAGIPPLPADQRDELIDGALSLLQMTPEQSEHVRRRLADSHRQRRKADKLPEDRKKADRNHKEERASPADICTQ